jgi:signal transduction histidine kinase
MVTVCCLLTGFAQGVSRYNTFSYSVNEGLLQTTIGDIEIDRNNFCWVSFPNGIQKFDGNSFSNVPVQPGLPDDRYTSFFRCKNGALLISHSQGISKYNIEADNFSLVYKKTAALENPVIFIGEESGILYCFDETGAITSFESTAFKILSVYKTNLPAVFSNTNTRPLFSDNIINHKAALKIGPAVYLLDLHEKRIIGQSTLDPIVYSFLLRLKSEYEVLYYDYRYGDALQCWNFKTNANVSLRVEGKDDKIIGRCVIFPWRNKTLLSFGNRLFVTDSTLQVLQSEMVNFQNLPVAGNVGIHRIKADDFGNLYIQTITGGLKKIINTNYPIKYFGSIQNTENNILSVLPDKKNNRILVGGSGGLLVFDTLQRLIKHIKTLPGCNLPFIPNGIIKTNGEDYFIFGITQSIAWLLNKNLDLIKAVPLINSITANRGFTAYFGNMVLKTDSFAIMQSQEKLFRIDTRKNTISEFKFSDAYIMSGLWYNNMIISHGFDDLIFLDAKTFKELKKIPFKATAGVRCFASDENGGLYVGSNKGIFKIDTSGKILKQWNKSTGLPDECIYAMAFDNGSLWCSSNKGVFRINKNNILQLTKEDGLQENEFNTNVLAQAGDGELFFGGVNGVSSFYPSAIGSFDETIKLFITRIRVNNNDLENDTATWNTGKLKLKYDQNSVSFDFVAMANNNPSQYTYQYRMIGLDKEWLQNSSLQTIRYSLPPGKYVFQLYASRIFDKEAKPMKEIRIIVRPPFWKTWWFIGGTGILILSLLTFAINQSNRRKYAKRLQQLENERQLKQERERISKDLHDSLGAYANAVLFNTDLLEKEKTEERRTVLIGDLKFVSKDIITSLRETVWALKKESYTAEECLVRIRNFLQPFTRYYEHIHFKTIGEAPPGRNLHYTKALNLVRIVQEAVSNSIKHAQATTIIVSSAVVDEKWEISIADNGKSFNYEAARKEEHGNGLFNMEQRAHASGFEYSIETQANSGTTITIIV